MVNATDMIGRLTTPETAYDFILAGNAYFTVRSAKTGTRFTFHVERAEPSEKNNWREMWFVSFLGGPENTTDYWYLGTIRNQPVGSRDRLPAPIFNLTKKSRAGELAPVTMAFNWVFTALRLGQFPKQVEIWHEGRCGMCGRKLTVPESIASGIGPTCAGRSNQ